MPTKSISFWLKSGPHTRASRQESTVMLSEAETSEARPVQSKHPCYSAAVPTIGILCDEPALNDKVARYS
jgi:hypothetical protein